MCGCWAGSASGSQATVGFRRRARPSDSLIAIRVSHVPTPASPLKLFETAERLQIDILHRVLSLGGIPENAPRDAVQPLVVALRELADGGRVAFDAAAYELGVRQLDVGRLNGGCPYLS